MLTDSYLRSLKATGKVQKKSDNDGLYIHVTEKGVKLWRMAYRFMKKQKTLSFGEYPYITLADARELKAEARKLIANNIFYLLGRLHKIMNRLISEAFYKPLLR